MEKKHSLSRYHNLNAIIKKYLKIIHALHTGSPSLFRRHNVVVVVWQFAHSRPVLVLVADFQHN